MTKPVKVVLGVGAKGDLENPSLTASAAASAPEAPEAPKPAKASLKFGSVVADE